VGNAHQNPDIVGNAHQNPDIVGNAHQNSDIVGNAHPTYMFKNQIVVLCYYESGVGIEKTRWFLEQQY
jgi:hypothetical protein